ncbi:Sodium/potassium/calcium exchanger 3 [Halotydeus destructor]|nr:Sodium/potassium/calcium exchanger 3 [Halotydeus destructor]
MFPNGRPKSIRTLLVRKFFLVLIVVLFSLVNIYFRKEKSSVSWRDSSDLDSSIVHKATLDNEDNSFPVADVDQDPGLGQDGLKGLVSPSLAHQVDSSETETQRKRRQLESTFEPLPTPLARKRRSLGHIISNVNSPDKVNTDHGHHVSHVSAINGHRHRRQSKGQKERVVALDENPGLHNDTDSTDKVQDRTTTKPALVAVSTMKPLINLVPAKENMSECEMPAYLQFPPDLFGNYLRTRGFIIVHFAIVCYMFYCLAVVCDNYFLPALEACAERLHLSEDVAGATFMAAGSSAPELFTALLGDVGTGTIVGSAVFNILFVIGLCGIFTASTQLNWWPVARDCAYYALTVLILIAVIYDGRVSTFESSVMLIFYLIYILIMSFNEPIRDLVVSRLPLDKLGLPHPSEIDALKAQQKGYGTTEGPVNVWSKPPRLEAYLAPSYDLYQSSLFEAACRIIIGHRWLFRPTRRFQMAGNLVIERLDKQKIYTKQANMAARGPSKAELKRALTAIRQDTTASTGRKASVADMFEPAKVWQLVPNPTVEGWLPVIKWCLIYPLHAALHYTIPDCRKKPMLFMVTFLASVLWTAIFSYVMVWMVVLIGFTFGIPDSIMGITFLAAGTSIPDAYASIHVAKAGQGDMAVSNSIGSNVFDILIGLALPWFIETCLVYPGTVAEVKSLGLAYAVVLLFVTLLITIFLFHFFNWTLNPKLGYSLIATYVGFLIITIALEFNLIGPVNAPMCDV